MEILRVKVIEINPASYNPRVNLKPGDVEYEKLKASIENFGYVDPIVWNRRTSNLVGGHQRYAVLLAQGVQELEVSVVDLDLPQEKLLNLALNRISGEWDNDKLGQLLQELKQMPDLDLGLTGFDVSEISQIIDEITEAVEDDFNLDESAANEQSITQLGELIELGRHRLLCGDSSKLDDMARLIGNKKINLIFCDPPYSVGYYGGNRPIPEKARSKSCKNWKRIDNDNLPQEEYEAWLDKIFENVMFYLATGAPFYIWNGHAQFGPMYQMLIKRGLHVSCVLTWAKPNFAIGYGDYNQQTEFCLYGWKEDNGAHQWFGPTNESTLWEIKRDPTKSYDHPTQKPVALAHRAIRNSSRNGDIVLDMFLGSGTTLIAAEGLNRICYGMEIDPGYCDVIIRRYIKLVGVANVPQELVDRYCREVKNECK